jgi:hypothetical protein
VCVGGVCACVCARVCVFFFFFCYVLWTDIDKPDGTPITWFCDL